MSERWKTYYYLVLIWREGCYYVSSPSVFLYFCYFCYFFPYVSSQRVTAVA